MVHIRAQPPSIWGGVRKGRQVSPRQGAKPRMRARPSIGATPDLARETRVRPKNAALNLTDVEVSDKKGTYDQ